MFRLGKAGEEGDRTSTVTKAQIAKRTIYREAHEVRLEKVAKKTVAESEKAALTEKDAHLWKCLSRTSNRGGGYIYRFQLRPEFDNTTPHLDLEKRKKALDAKHLEIFPAVELVNYDMFRFCNLEISLESLLDEEVEKEIQMLPPFSIGREDLKKQLREGVEKKSAFSLFSWNWDIRSRRIKRACF